MSMSASILYLGWHANGNIYRAKKGGVIFLSGSVCIGTGLGQLHTLYLLGKPLAAKKLKYKSWIGTDPSVPNL